MAAGSAGTVWVATERIEAAEETGRIGDADIERGTEEADNDGR